MNWIPVPLLMGHAYFVFPLGTFVLGSVSEMLAIWFTAWMRDAHALGLGIRGGRTSAAKSSTTSVSSARMPHQGFLVFIYGLSCVLLTVILDTFENNLKGF